MSGKTITLDASDMEDFAERFLNVIAVVHCVRAALENEVNQSDADRALAAAQAELERLAPQIAEWNDGAMERESPTRLGVFTDEELARTPIPGPPPALPCPFCCAVRDIMIKETTQDDDHDGDP